MDQSIPARAISPLHQRLIDDMNMRRFSRETQCNDICVGHFATFLRRSPDMATADDVRRFQIEQRDAGVPTPTMNSIVSASSGGPLGRLGRWPACGGGRGAQGCRRRQRTHVAQGRAWQGWSISQRHAPGRSPDLAAGVAEGRVAIGRAARTRPEILHDSGLSASG